MTKLASQNKEFFSPKMQFFMKEWRLASLEMGMWTWGFLKIGKPNSKGWKTFSMCAPNQNKYK